MTKPRITRRTLEGAHRYYCERSQRWVIFRRSGGIERRTSIRGGREENEWKAELLSNALHTHPAGQLQTFKW